MDLATVLGIGGALGLVFIAMLLSGDISIFMSAPSMIIVIGGSACAVMAKYGLRQFLSGLTVASKSFRTRLPAPTWLIETIMDLSQTARREGLLAFDGRTFDYEPLQNGVNLLVDGIDPVTMRSMMVKEKQLTFQRQAISVKVFKDLAKSAPAMGMIGTLIGLVAMLTNMSSPESIGPAMAVALLTTLYGAILANAIAEPIADKLVLRAKEEMLLKEIIIDGLLAIQDGKNPRVIQGILQTYLPKTQQDDEALA